MWGKRLMRMSFIRMKLGGGGGKLVFYAEPASKAVSWQSVQTCK